MHVIDLIKRAENLGIKDSWVIKAVIRNGEGYRFRPFSWFETSWGKGRRWVGSDDSEIILKELDMLGIKYKLGNDAPRSGRAGDFIEIRTKIGKIREKSLKKIPMITIRIEGEVYGKITS